MKKWYFAVPIAILLLGIAFLFSRNQSTTPANVDITPEATVLQTSNVEKIEFNCESGKSVFETLQDSHNIKFTESDLGNLVTSIDEVEQSDGKYWLYSINDKEATVGASTYICQDAEKITWELK